MSRSDSLYLTPESGEIKGNNPYQLNRMRIDPSFKTSLYDLSKVIGYGATGEIIYDGHKAPASVAPKAASVLYASNQHSQLAPYGEETESFTSKKKRKQKSVVKDLEHALADTNGTSDWVHAFQKSQDQSHKKGLAQLNEEHYRKIMQQKTNYHGNTN
jgi:hypothetical protein